MPAPEDMKGPSVDDRSAKWSPDQEEAFRKKLAETLQREKDKAILESAAKIEASKIELTGTIEEKTPGAAHDALSALHEAVAKGANQDALDRARAEADAVIDGMVEATIRIIGTFPPEHRKTGLFLHFCGHTDGAENGMKIGATTTMLLLGGTGNVPTKQVWPVVKQLGQSGLENYMATVSQRIMAAFIEKYAPGETADAIIDEFATLEERLFPELVAPGGPWHNGVKPS